MAIFRRVDTCVRARLHEARLPPLGRVDAVKSIAYAGYTV